MACANDRPAETDVLVVGAGPTGLFLAFTLARQGISVRLIDRHSGPSVESRAMGVQARTLEFYRMMGLADEAVSLGVRTGNAHVWVEGEERASFSLARMGAGLSPYPFLLTLAQDVHERFLIERLADLGVVPEWNTEIVGLDQTDAEVVATLRHKDRDDETLTVPWLVGCDGGRSFVREALGIGFSGGTTEGLFFVADVEVAHANQDVHVGIGPETLALMMPVRTSGTQRLIGIVPEEVANRGNVVLQDVGPRAAELLGTEVQTVNWFSTYRVHHRVAERFRVGRCFIAGDAGHIHSPVGGQGMNTGLGDAMNLGWKLAHVVNGAAAPGLLDSYEPERIAIARTLIATTDSAFQNMVADSWLAQHLRLHVAPFLIRQITKSAFAARTLFKSVSQIRISYGDSPLSSGTAGRITAGDRLPWVESHDTHAGLDGIRWTAHAIGDVDPELSDELEASGIPLHRWPDDGAMKAAGFEAGALYLVRPDGHVGLAEPEPGLATVGAYLATQAIDPTAAETGRRKPG